MKSQAHRVVILGGGAGGLELAIRLGRRFRRERYGTKLEVTLVDRSLTHVWKPLYHELAAGTRGFDGDEVHYLELARLNNFRFHVGALVGIDRTKRLLSIAGRQDQLGREVVPKRFLGFDTLFVAIGSVPDTFGIPGVAEHCFFIDSQSEARGIHEEFFNACLRLDTGRRSESQKLNIAIVGGGATGVELAAELRHTISQIVHFGFDRIIPDRDITVTVIEAAKRLLPQLPEQLSAAVQKQLNAVSIGVVTSESAAQVTAEAIVTKSGRIIPADIKVWTAGIKASSDLAERTDLETNAKGQLVVRATLQTTRDERIFAFGDCAAVPDEAGRSRFPPRAQTAAQQAEFLAGTVDCIARNQPLPEFHYVDRGSLVAMSSHSAVGRLMGNLFGTITIDGWLARLAYRMLYRRHQIVLYGLFRGLVLIFCDVLTRSVRPRMKLH